MIMSAIPRQLWSSYSAYLFHGDFLPTSPEANPNYQIVLGRFAEIADTYYSGLTALIGKTQLEYLRRKFQRGDPYIAIANVEGSVANVLFSARPICYNQVSILDKRSYVIGPSITVEKFRGQGIFTAVMKFMRSSDLGRDGLDVFCRVENVGSRKGILKAGYVLKMQYHHTTCFGINFIHPENAAS